jgi:hypothetical protein
MENILLSMYGSCAGSEGMNFDAMTKENAIACVVDNQLQVKHKCKLILLVK